MVRPIDDAGYIECLASPMYQQYYYRWKSRMLGQIEQIVRALEEKPVDEVMAAFKLTQRDIALLVRLGYFTGDEVDRFGLREIEAGVPL